MNVADNHNITESDLIRGALTETGGCRNYYIRLFLPRCMVSASAMPANAEDAQDILQEGFIKVFRNLDRFRGGRLI
jgi:RNA polymerase sigma-70 factor (ECF subfamily)